MKHNAFLSQQEAYGLISEIHTGAVKGGHMELMRSRRIDDLNVLKIRVGKGPWCVPKQLLLIPHRFAIAMQDEGLIVRTIMSGISRRLFQTLQ